VFRIYLMTIPLSLLFASPLLRATGDLRTMLWADVASLIMSVGALVLLAKPFGSLGAVGSLVAGYATFVLWASRLNAARLGLSFRRFLPWTALARVLLLSVGAALVGFYLFSNAAAIVRTLFGGGLGLVMYAAVAWRVGLVHIEERQLVMNALHSFRRRLTGSEPAEQTPNG
jgi:uncharacterized membrane protein